MGCSTTREVLESKMLLLKLRRIEIKKAREDNCKELSKLTGSNIVREPIKDYLIYPDDDQLMRQQQKLLNGTEENKAQVDPKSPTQEEELEDSNQVPIAVNRNEGSNSNIKTHHNSQMNSNSNIDNIKKKSSSKGRVNTKTRKYVFVLQCILVKYKERNYK